MQIKKCSNCKATFPNTFYLSEQDIDKIDEMERIALCYLCELQQQLENEGFRLFRGIEISCCKTCDKIGDLELYLDGLTLGPYCVDCYNSRIDDIWKKWKG